MNKLIETILNELSVEGKKIPHAFLIYNGSADTYVTYQQTDADNTFNADDELQGYVDFYDFDIYSKGNYNKIIKQLKAELIKNGFMWQPGRSSGDMFEIETKLYHKTLSFAIYKEET